MNENQKQRIALSIFFLISGFSFATWASRIPTIKSLFDLNDAELGNILLILPISSLLGLPISGWLVSKFDSRKPMIISFVFFNIALALIGFSQSILMLAFAVFLFSFTMRIINIAINTQSISVQRNFVRNIVGSFHGLWSVGGLMGVAFSTLMVKLEVPMDSHTLMVSTFSMIAILI